MLAVIIELRYPSWQKFRRIRDLLQIAGWRRKDNFHYQFRTRIRNRAETCCSRNSVSRAYCTARWFCDVGWLFRGWNRMSCYPAACTLHMHALPRALPSSLIRPLSPYFQSRFARRFRARGVSFSSPFFKKARGKSPQAASIIDTSTGWIHPSRIPPTCFSSSPAVPPHIRRGFQWILKIISRLANRSHLSTLYTLPWLPSGGSHFGTTLCLDYYSLLCPFYPLLLKIPFETDAVMQIRARIFINVILRRSEAGPLPPGWSRGGAWLVAPASVTKPKECVSRICIKSTQTRHGTA